MENTNERLWTKEFVLLSVINFLATIVFFLLLVTIAQFAVSEFDASTSTAGLASSIFIIGSLLGRLGGGRLIGQWGGRNVLLYGLIGFFLTSLLYFATFNLTLLLIYRLLQGLVVGLVGTATGTMVAQIVPISRRGEGIGYFSLSAILSTAFGPFIGMFLLQIFNGFQAIFIFSSTLAMVVLVMFFFIKFPDHLVKPTPPVEKKQEAVFSKYIERSALPISIITLLLGFTYCGILSFMSFYLEGINLETIGGYFFLIYAAVVVITRPYLGKLFDTHGANKIIYPCLIIFAVGMYLFSSATTSLMLVLAAICIGIGYGNFTSVAQALAIKETSPERMGIATSTFFMLHEFSLGFGPYIIGLLVPLLGYRSIFGWMVVVILISIVLYYVLHGKKETAMKKFQTMN